MNEIVYNALNKRLATKTAKGWKLEWVKMPNAKEHK